MTFYSTNDFESFPCLYVFTLNTCKQTQNAKNYDVAYVKYVDYFTTNLELTVVSLHQIHLFDLSYENL